MFSTKILLLLLLLSLLILSNHMTYATNAQRKKRRRQYTVSKRYCQKSDCANVLDDDPNCIYKCISNDCYQEIYANEPLEPGEIDFQRDKLFQNCYRTERIQNMKKN